MIEPAVAMTFFVKMIPYVVGMKVVTASIDVGAHWVKSKIGRGSK
jgi:hypothetical protein